jgi:hypothetical protein
MKVGLLEVWSGRDWQHPKPEEVSRLQAGHERRRYWRASLSGFTVYLYGADRYPSSSRPDYSRAASPH